MINVFVVTIVVVNHMGRSPLLRGIGCATWGEALSSGGSVVPFPGCNGGSKFPTLIDLSIEAGANLEKSASGRFRSHLDLSKNTRDVSRDPGLVVAAVENVQKYHTQG